MCGFEDDRPQLTHKKISAQDNWASNHIIVVVGGQLIDKLVYESSATHKNKYIFGTTNNNRGSSLLNILLLLVLRN